jgi:AcrR family transcriptional regulator
MGVLERKEREKELRRQQILNSGEYLFVKQGLQGTTMEQIANECEISRGTLYLYFDSKESLFNTILLKGINILFDLMKTEVTSRDNVEEKLRGIGNAYLDFYKNHRNYFKLINQFEDRTNLKQDGTYETTMRVYAGKEQIWGLITEVIEAGVRSGYFKENINPFETAILLWSSSNGIIHLMDHIHVTHMNNGSGKVLRKPADKGPATTKEIIKIDFEQLLRNMWSMLLDSIRKPKH